MSKHMLVAGIIIIVTKETTQRDQVEVLGEE